MVRLRDEITLHRPGPLAAGVKRNGKGHENDELEWIESQVEDAIFRQSTCLSPVEAADIGQLLGRGACPQNGKFVPRVTHHFLHLLLKVNSQQTAGIFRQLSIFFPSEIVGVLSRFQPPDRWDLIS